MIGITMGSRSDWETMSAAAAVLEELGIAHEVRVLSAHRTPDLALEYAEQAEARGLQALICGAGGAAHLAGIMAAKTALPVLGVPMEGWALNGLDALLSTVMMPGGIPVATFAIGQAGAKNAALFAAAILARQDPRIREALERYRQEQTRTVSEIGDPREDH